MYQLGRWQLMWTSWFAGVPLIWNEMRLNSGRSYTVWRIGPVLLRKFDK